MTPQGPYPGLRPFRRDEGEIFFGREEHADQLLEKLGETHFVAVLGRSGSGKSSLVHTGLLPALDSGFLAKAGARWNVAELRPGNHPMERLCGALIRQTEWGRGYVNGLTSIPAAERQLLAELAKGPMALLWLLGIQPLPDNNRLLIIVDQFEELFRYHSPSSALEVKGFIERILAASEHPDVYVVITMRSDYLDDCAVYDGLPEAINAGLYLTPQLNAEQMADAIQLPARVFGGDVEPALVHQLLNEAGGEMDQLPLLQHALMRLWELDDGDRILTADEFRKLGGLKRALNDHAEEAFAELDADQQAIMEVMCRCLTERGPDGRDVRRPVSAQEVALLAGIDKDLPALEAVVDVFRQPGRCFITPPTGVALSADSPLDISHEALIRQWRRLLEWTTDEAEQAELYQRLESAAQRWSKGKGACWAGPDLEEALQWRAEKSPSPAWATRYKGDFGLAMRFLEASTEQRERLRKQAAEARRAARRRRWAIALSCLVGASVFFFLVWEQFSTRRAYDTTQALLSGREAVAEARSFSRAMEFDAALASLSTAEEIFRNLNVVDDLTAVLLDQGKILATQDPADSKRVYEEARVLAVKTGDLEVQARAEEGLANLVETSSTSTTAFPFNTALELYQKAGDHRGVARLLERRAKWRSNQGRLTRADWLQVDQDLQHSAQEYRLAGDADAAQRAELQRNWGYLVDLRSGALRYLPRSQKDVDLGRSPASVFHYDNTLVSRKHVELYQNDPYQQQAAAPPIIFPLRSRNGTTLNGIPTLYASAQPLESGDVIVFASEGVQFHTDPLDPPQPTKQDWGVLVSHQNYRYLEADHLWLSFMDTELSPRPAPPTEGPQLEIRWQNGCAEARAHGNDWVFIGWGKDGDYDFKGWTLGPDTWHPLSSGPYELRKIEALQRPPEPGESAPFHILPLCEVTAETGCCQ